MFLSCWDLQAGGSFRGLSTVPLDCGEFRWNLGGGLLYGTWWSFVLAPTIRPTLAYPLAHVLLFHHTSVTNARVGTVAQVRAQVYRHAFEN